MDQGQGILMDVLFHISQPEHSVADYANKIDEFKVVVNKSVHLILGHQDHCRDRVQDWTKQDGRRWF
jgi:hypothetical protein